MKKYFTPEEANTLLPQVKRDLAALQDIAHLFEDKYMELQDRKSEYDEHAAKQSGRDEDPFFELECEIEFMRMEADAMIRGFALKGVQLKMIDPGLVDFPARLNGRDVLLCWKQGEEEVGHYHGLEDGYMGRKPVSAEWPTAGDGPLDQ